RLIIRRQNLHRPPHHTARLVLLLRRQLQPLVRRLPKRRRPTRHRLQRPNLHRLTRRLPLPPRRQRRRQRKTRRRQERQQISGRHGLGSCFDFTSSSSSYLNNTPFPHQNLSSHSRP